jgi:uncharacterized cupredoxin-like copper-binding protein
MKLSRYTVYRLALFGIFSISTTTIFAHAETDSEGMPLYDSTVTEFGSFDPELHATRTVRVIMDDNMQFTPNVIHVKKGEVVRIVPVNIGKLIHEFVLGTEASLAEHAELMERFPNMEHDNPNLVHVDPGGVRGITWSFTQQGTVIFACLIPGHYEAGMKGIVSVQ